MKMVIESVLSGNEHACRNPLNYSETVCNYFWKKYTKSKIVCTRLSSNKLVYCVFKMPIKPGKCNTCSDERKSRKQRFNVSLYLVVSSYDNEKDSQTHWHTTGKFDIINSWIFKSWYRIHQRFIHCCGPYIHKNDLSENHPENADCGWHS